MDDHNAGGFQSSLQASPIKRAKRRGLLRNVPVALGNWGYPEAFPALAIALNGEEPLVRGRAAWALGRLGTNAAQRSGAYLVTDSVTSRCPSHQLRLPFQS